MKFLIFFLFTAFISLAYSQVVDVNKQLLWEISGNGLKEKSYLFGTLHSNDKRIFDLSDSVYYAIDRSNLIILEADIFELFKVNSDRVAQGLNEYVDKEGDIPNTFETVSGVDIKKLSNLIGSGYGYGYYYAREKANGDLFMTSIMTEKDLEKFVGVLNNVQIKYPNKGAKALYIKVDTKSEILGDINYIIEVRNTSGLVLPLSLKMKSSK